RDTDVDVGVAVVEPDRSAADFPDANGSVSAARGHVAQPSVSWPPVAKTSSQRTQNDRGTRCRPTSTLPTVLRPYPTNRASARWVSPAASRRAANWAPNARRAARVSSRLTGAAARLPAMTGWDACGALAWDEP